jgi:hypothetical protein
MELLYANPDSLNLEAGPTTVAAIAGAAVVGGAAGYFGVHGIKRAMDWIVSLPQSLSTRRKLNTGFRWGSSLGGLALLGLFGAAATTAIDPRPSYIGKRAAQEMVASVTPEENYCRLVRNIKYLDNVLAGKTPIPLQERSYKVVSRNGRAIDDAVGCGGASASFVANAIEKGHRLQADHYTLELPTNLRLDVNGLSSSGVDYTFASTQKFGEVEVAGTRYWGLGDVRIFKWTPSGPERAFGGTIPRALFSVQRYSEQLEGMSQEVPSLPKADYAIFAFLNGGDEIRVRARAEDGTEVDVTRFAKKDAKGVTEAGGLYLAAQQLLLGDKK